MECYAVVKLDSIIDFSYNLGMQKPDTRIYDLVECVTGYSGEDILFIDDMKPNIDNAAAKSWNVLLTTVKNIEEIQKHCYSFVGE